MEIEISIELVVFLAITLLLFVWALWYIVTKWIAKLRYKPNNDKSRYGEEKRRRLAEGGEPIPTLTVKGFPGSSELTERGILPPPDVSSTGEDSKRPRGFFARRRK